MAQRYLSSKEACELLGVRSQTLYSYVSRGLIRSEAASGKSRARQYHREDVERLSQRKQLRADPSKAAHGALRAGEPVMESALTLLTESAVYYRGWNALELARTRSIEEVAWLLWTGDLEVETAIPKPDPLGSIPADLSRGLQHLGPIQRVQALLPVVAAEDPAAVDLHPRSLYRVGWRILHLIAAVASGSDPLDGGIARALQQAWLPGRDEATRVLEAALILSADHELNVSAFTARCVASSGANLYCVVVAALSALQGFHHGAGSQRVEAMWQEVEADGDASRAVARRLERGDLCPGFGHVIYTGMDPRAGLLMELLEEHFPGSEAVAFSRRLRAAVSRATDLECNVDLALVTLRRAAGLPPGSAMLLFALGRTVGWIGHAIEHYETGKLIRPRALYVGPRPEDVAAKPPGE